MNALTLGYGSTRTVARLLGCAPSTVRRMAQRGELERVDSDFGFPLYRMEPVVRRAVLAALPGTAAQIATSTGIPAGSVRRALAGLAEAGEVVERACLDTRGRPARCWELSPRGGSPVAGWKAEKVSRHPSALSAPQIA